MVRKQTSTLLIITLLIAGLLSLCFPPGGAVTTSNPPEVLPTAPTTVQMVEDSGTVYLDLYDIYKDTGATLSFTVWTGTAYGSSFTNERITVSVKANDTLECSPKADMFGVDKITVNATNSNQQSTTHEMTVTITPINDAPVLEMIGNLKITDTSYASIFIYQGEWYNATVTASDVDGDTLVFIDNSSIFNINYRTGNISFKPTQDDVGIHEVNITVSDINGSNSEDTVFVKFNILNKNDPPTVQIYSPENGSVVYQERFMIFSGEGFDPDLSYGDYLSYTWYSDLDGVLGYDQKIEVYYLTVGVHTITLNATDSQGLSDEDSVIIEVKRSYFDSYYEIELEMKENFLILKQGEQKSLEVTVYNYGGEIDNISFSIEEFLDFPGKVELQVENITLKPKESAEFLVKIGVPTDAKVGLYIIELNTKSSWNTDDDNSTDPNNYRYGYEDSESIKIIVITNSSDTPKEAAKPEWNTGYQWLYSMKMQDLGSFAMNGTMSMTITDDTNIEVNDKSYDVFKMVLDSNLELDINQSDMPYFGSMELKMGGMNYFQKSNLATVKSEIKAEYTTRMFGESVTYGSEITSIYDPPLNEFDYPIKAGEQWKVISTVNEEIRQIEIYDDDYDDSYTYDSIEKQKRSYICIGTESTTVPAGTFETFMVMEYDRDTEYLYDDYGNDYGIEPGYDESGVKKSSNSGSRSMIIDTNTEGDDQFAIMYYSPEARMVVKEVTYTLTYVYNDDDDGVWDESYEWRETARIELLSYSLDTPDTDPAKNDLDNDSLPDFWEDRHDVDNPFEDQDGDGFTNYEEYLNGTDPQNSNDNPLDPIDNDEDGLPNTFELDHGLNPYDADDANADKDKDGYTNKEEFDSHTSISDPSDHPTFKKKNGSNDGLGYSVLYLIIIVSIIVILILFAVARHGRKTSKKSGGPDKETSASRVEEPRAPQAKVATPSPTVGTPGAGRVDPMYEPRTPVYNDHYQSPGVEQQTGDQYSGSSPSYSPSPNYRPETPRASPTPTIAQDPGTYNPSPHPQSQQQPQSSYNASGYNPAPAPQTPRVAQTPPSYQQEPYSGSRPNYYENYKRNSAYRDDKDFY
jgi:hypothetical protein